MHYKERNEGRKAAAARGIIMAISELKSRDIIRDNSIYYFPSINVQPLSLRWLARSGCLFAVAAAAGVIKN